MGTGFAPTSFMKRVVLTATFLLLLSCSGAPRDLHDAETPLPAPSDAATAAVASGGANLTVHVGGGTFVLVENEVATGMGAGAPTLLANEREVVTVTRAVEASKMPAALGSAKGSAVTVVADSGTRCVAHVTDVVLFAQVSPDWDVAARFAGKEADEYGPRVAPLGDSEIAKEAFELGERGAHLALVLDLDRESCAGAHFALVSVDAETARPLPANVASAETATVAFRALPESLAYDAQYVEYFEGRSAAEDKANGVVRGTSWDTYAGQTPSVHRFVLGDESLLFVTAGVEEGCGGLNTQLSVLFRETAEGPVAIRTWENFSREALAIVTAPDGYDVIFDNVKGRTSAAHTTNVEPLVFGCRC